MSHTVMCAGCGQTLPSDYALPGLPAPPSRWPCPNCGSLSRVVQLSIAGSSWPPNVQGNSIIISNSSPIQVEPDVIRIGQAYASTSVVGMPPSESINTLEDRTLVGDPVVHKVELRFAPAAGGDGRFYVEVRRDDEVIQLAYGDDAVDALLNLFPALLPPDHPEHDTKTDHPDDVP